MEIYNMSAKSFSDTVLEEFDAIDWENVAVDLFRDVSMDAMCDGIYTYITNEDNRIVTCLATGTITPPTPPSPYSGDVEVSFAFPTASSLISLMDTYITSETQAGDMTGFFTAISTWLSTPVIVATVIGWSTEGIGVASGAGTLSFPAMTSQASPSTAEMQATKPTTRDAAWAILQKYVILGLTGGIITVPAIVGTVGTSAFTGSGSGTVNYN